MCMYICAYIYISITCPLCLLGGTGTDSSPIKVVLGSSYMFPETHSTREQPLLEASSPCGPFLKLLLGRAGMKSGKHSGRSSRRRGQKGCLSASWFLAHSREGEWDGTFLWCIGLLHSLTW